MKQRILIKEIKSKGFYFLRHGSDHDIYTNGEVEIEIPRHREINEKLAKKIIKDVEG